VKSKNFPLVSRGKKHDFSNEISREKSKENMKEKIERKTESEHKKPSAPEFGSIYISSVALVDCPQKHTKKKRCALF